MIVGGTTASVASKSKIITGNHAKWKRKMDKADRIMFESIAGDLLKSLGYETEGLHRPISRVEQFGWKLHHFVRIVIKRLSVGNKKDWMPDHLVMKWALLRSYMRFEHE